MMFNTWSDVLRICFMVVVITGSADDFWRAVGVAGGGIAAFMLGRRQSG
jgi:hypothetical protein